MLVSLLQASGWLCKVSHDHFVSCPVQFVTQSHFHRSTLCDLHSQHREQQENQSQCVALQAVDRRFDRGSADCRLVSAMCNTAPSAPPVVYQLLMLSYKSYHQCRHDRMWGAGVEINGIPGSERAPRALLCGTCFCLSRYIKYNTWC